MQFTKNFKAKFANGMREQYKVYWHAMHPLNFDPMELVYVHGFTDEVWSAMKIVQEYRPDIIRTSRRFRLEITSLQPSPYIPDGASVHFDLDEKDYPDLNIPDTKILNAAHRRQVLEWVDTAYRYRADSNELYRVCSSLMEEFNTPGQLYRFWPAMLPFMPQRYRDGVRTSKVRSALPEAWRFENKVKVFFESPTIQRLEDALLVMSLIPKNHDGHYPRLHDF